jgi:CBS domain-containing protein
MTTVAHILAAKGREVWSIPPTASVYEAISRMADHEVGALVVLDGDRLAGIISERDYARKVILRGRDARTTPVSEIMTSRVLTVTPADTVENCMALMTAKRIRHLPVVSDGGLEGMISIGDLVKSLISERDDLIQQLENYITGTR